MFFALPDWDRALFTLLNQQWRGPLLDALLPVFSWTWLIWTLGGGCAVVLGLRARRRGGTQGMRRAVAATLCVLLAVGLADAATDYLKDSCCRSRPLNCLPLTWHQEDGLWLQRPADFTPRPDTCGSSFPSGHATNTMAVAAAIILLRGGRGRWLLLLPLLTGWSRVYLGKHFPSDVMAGWIMGLTGAAIAWALWRLARKRLED